MKDTSAKENMTKTLKTIPWDAPMVDAWELMDKNRIRHLPVTDKNAEIIGILSDRDVNKAMNPTRPGFAPDCKVNDFMNWPVITVDGNCSVKKVALAMITDKISAVLVTKEKKVVGILTSEDLLRFLVDCLGDQRKKASFDFSFTPLISELLHETQSVGI